MTWVLLIRGIQADEHRVVELRERVRKVLEDTPFEGTVTLDEALFESLTRPAESVSNGVPQLEHQARLRSGKGALPA